MMNRNEIENIASLMKLDVSKESDAFIDEINSMIKIMDRISEIELTANDFEINMELINTFREDEIRPSIPREAVLANAFSVEAGCVSVPKIMGKEE